MLAGSYSPASRYLDSRKALDLFAAECWKFKGSDMRFSDLKPETQRFLKSMQLVVLGKDYIQDVNLAKRYADDEGVDYDDYEEVDISVKATMDEMIRMVGLVRF
jgi:hypothetical protein